MGSKDTQLDSFTLESMTEITSGIILIITVTLGEYITWLILYVATIHTG